MLLAGLLYAGVVGAEFVEARFPERNLPSVQVEAVPWSAPVVWQYEVRNIVDTPVGEAQCTLTPDADEYIFHPYTWRQATQDSGPQARLVLVMVIGQEEVNTPAGTFTAWKVQVGDRETAWYAINAPHTLVKYFDGGETWLLEE
ncbi:MAG TPA: hypothetical protein PLN71_03435 [Anaerolineae bacterium]|nr:hypothetical protein [Anaerolineae bacterium]